MAYATKYLFKWESAKGTTREIRILKDGYSGSVIQRALGRAPILKKQKNGAVFGTSLEFYAECRVEGEFTEFYTTNPKAYKVQLYAGNTLLWQGYVTPELYSEPDIAPPFDVQVIATDGIGELKLYDFEPQGTVALRSIFTYLLGYTGLGTDVYLISSLKAGSSGAGALLEKTINLDYMAGESCYDVLTYLLGTLHATITWWRGAWIVARETNVTFTNSKVRYFNTAGNSALLAGSVQTLGKMYVNDVWPVGQLSRKVDPAKKSVTVQAPWHPVQGLLNPYMTSDVSWIKNSYVTYDAQRRCYAFSEASSGGSAFGCIKQSLSMLALRVPMSFAVKGTGFGRKQIQTQSGWFWTNGLIGVVISYQVGSTTYILREGEEGYEWQEGQLPNFDPFYWTQRGGGEGIPSKSFDTALADRENSEELRIDSIPTFDQDGTFPAGTLMIQIAGQHCDIYSAELNITIPKGYQDRLHLDNGARGEGDEVEVAIGRETSDIDYYKAFLQGILLDSGSLITSFKDDAITTGMDFLSFISRDYARSFALPRIVRSGTVQLEAAVEFPPLVLTKAAVDYWLETWSWNMYEDELEISARSLPTASITVDSEVISEASGTTSSEGRSGGGTSSMSGAGGAADLSVLEQGLASGLAWLSSRIGSIESWLAEPQLDELLVGDLNVERQINLAGATLTYHPAANGNAAYVYLDTTLVTKGDQVTNDGTPGSGGGGGGGKNWLAELLDVEENMHPSDGQVLAWKTGIELNDGTTGDGWGNLTLGALATRNNITTSFVTDIETWIAGKGYATQAWVQEQGYVTTSGVTSIAMTVPTGFSVTGSPITSTGTLALAFASGYSLPTTAKQSNWDTAYGWGNHALAGYAYASDQEKIEAALAAGLALLAGRISGLEDWLAEPQLDELLVGDINVERVLNVGGATFVYHPADGANAAYIYLDTALVTAGDQVTNDGNPGSGGGGSGKSWLSELLDVKASMAPSAGQVLMWQNNVVRNDGTTAPGWANASLGALATRDNITTTYVTDLETWIAGKGYVTTSGVTSIAVTVPTGFAVSGSPVTSAGTVAIDFATGYSLPTTAKQTNWDTAYSDHHTHSNKTTLDGITSTKVSNWDSAYSWGNHASVGYAMGTDLAAVERGAVQADAALSARISSLEDWFSEPQLDELLVGSLCADNINLGGESMRSIPNAFLANSALTINGSVTALGSSFNTANITAGTAGTSSATSGVSFAIPYVTMNKYGIVTAYGTHTHSISQANMFGSSAIGSSALPVYYNGSALTACTKGDLFSALSSSAATNLSVTVAGQTRSITNLYATYDSEGSNIATQAHAIERILSEGVAGVSARVKSLEDWFAEPQVDELLAGAVNVERTLNLGGISMRASGNKLYIGDAGHYIEIKGTNAAPILYMNVTLQTAGDQAIA